KLEDAATQYASYRSNKFKVLRVNSSQLYDTYFYGNTHPIALKRLAKHLVKEASVAPSYLLLLGKGYQTNLLRTQQYYDKNLVSALGVPASDNMISAGIKGNGFWAEIPTGRVPAATNEQALNYLQ